MRKILFGLSIALLFSGAALAQTTRLGITGGPTYSTMFTKVNGEKDLGDFRVGATAGVMIDVAMEKNGSFRTGVNFVQKGTRQEYMSGNDEVKLTRRLNYVEFPLMVMFNLPIKGQQLRLGGGPAGAFAISGKDKLKINGNESESDIDFGDKTDSDLNWVDFGINVQAEYEFDGGVFLAAGYSHGINRLFVGGAETDKLYNRYFSLRLGYFFNWGKKK